MWIFKDDLQRNLFAVGISKISLFYFKNNTIKKIKFLTKEKKLFNLTENYWVI